MADEEALKMCIRDSDYATPLGKSVFYREVTDANRTVLRMSEVGPLSAGVDVYKRQEENRLRFRQWEKEWKVTNEGDEQTMHEWQLSLIHI